MAIANGMEKTMHSPALDVETLHPLRAEQIGGSCSNSLYDAVEQIVASRDLRGAALDYGAGAGNLTRRLAASGQFDRVTAVDIVSRPEGLEAVRWIEQDLNDPLDAGSEEFDFVVATGVIECLENARFTVREIARVLRPGGTAIVTTSNSESWRSILSFMARGRHAAFDAGINPGTITALSRQDFVRIFGESDLSSPSFYFSRRGSLPGMPARSWQQISFGLLRGVRFSEDLIAVATKPQTRPA
jgi:SAM-dependent methyltransferase